MVCVVALFFCCFILLIFFHPGRINGTSGAKLIASTTFRIRPTGFKANMRASLSETEMTRRKTASAKDIEWVSNPLSKPAVNAGVTGEEKKDSREDFGTHAVVYDFSLPNGTSPNDGIDASDVCTDAEAKLRSDRSLLWTTPFIYSIVTLFTVIAVSYLMFLTSNTIVNKQCIELSNIACRQIRTVFQGSLSRQLDVVKQVASMIGRREGLNTTDGKSYSKLWRKGVYRIWGDFFYECLILPRRSMALLLDIVRKINVLLRDTNTQNIYKNFLKHK